MFLCHWFTINLSLYTGEYNVEQAGCKRVPAWVCLCWHSWRSATTWAPPNRTSARGFGLLWRSPEESTNTRHVCLCKASFCWTVWLCNKTLAKRWNKPSFCGVQALLLNYNATFWKCFMLSITIIHIIVLIIVCYYTVYFCVWFPWHYSPSLACATGECCEARLTSFCSSSGRASVNRVIQKLRGAIFAVMRERSSLAASVKRSSPYNLWNSRYFPEEKKCLFVSHCSLSYLLLMCFNDTNFTPFLLVLSVFFYNGTVHCMCNWTFFTDILPVKTCCHMLLH